jgi:hypothetical protein
MANFSPHVMSNDHGLSADLIQFGKEEGTIKYIKFARKKVSPPWPTRLQQGNAFWWDKAKISGGGRFDYETDQ